MIKKLVIGVTVAAGLGCLVIVFKKFKNKNENTSILDHIGKTPLIYLPKLSKALGCKIYCKAEHLNPFGSSKDRPVRRMLQIAQKNQMFKDRKEVIQASSGSTAISLVQICKILNLKATLYLPNDLAQDKYTYLQTLGANIVKVPQVSIVDPNHFFKLAQTSSQQNSSFFLNQFENLQNYKVHLQQTGPEIYEQTNGKIDAFVCSAGTGGTMAGVSNYLKSKNHLISTILADPEGSGLYNKVKYGTMFTIQQKQGYRLKNPFDTVIQGVGLNRHTANFNQAQIDDSFKIKDQQALHMAYYLIQNEGLFVGGSSALNLACVVKYARDHPGQTIVTIIHDSGNRYLKKFYSMTYLKQKNIHFQKRKQYLSDNLDFIE